MTFKELELNSDLLKALDEMGYVEPTKIQSDVLKESKEFKNIIWQSQTGTGKTAAFVLSLLQNMDRNKRWTQTLIIAPTRELVTQIKEEIFKLTKYHRVSSIAVYGWSPIYKQVDLIRKWQDIVVGTPWRVIDLIERKVLKLEHINFFVLDEVDRMLDMWFIDDIEYIWQGLKNLKQVFSFSATVTPEIKTIIEKYIWDNYSFIKSTTEITTDKIDHSFIESTYINKYPLLLKFIESHKSQKTIVFVQTKKDTEMLADKLCEDWFKASYLNWDMRQRERFKALKDFQEWYSDIFVVTDVAARWLNMKNIDLVINFDVPTDPESYIHRIGRTGRAGAEWKAVMFVSGSEKYALKNIEKINKIKIKQVNDEWVEIERKEEQRPSRWGFGGSRWRFGSRWGSSFWSRWGSRGWFGWSRSSGERRWSWERRSFWSRDNSFRKSDDSQSVESKRFEEKRSFTRNNDERDDRRSYARRDNDNFKKRETDEREHKSSGYFAKRDERRWQRSTTRAPRRDWDSNRGWRWFSRWR